MKFTSKIALTLLCAVCSLKVQALPEIQNWSTPKGAKVLFVAAPELPMVDIRVIFDAGSTRDGNQPGLATLTLGLLDQGAAGMDAGEIARGFEDRGAIISGGAQKEMAWLALRSLSDDDLLQPSLALFEKVLLQPDFPRNDFKREKERTLVSIQYQKQKPGSLVSNRFYKEVFGSHSYGSNQIGTEASIGKLKAGDLRKFYKQYYVAKNAMVVIVGDLTRAQAEAISVQLADGLADGERPPALAEVKARTDATTIMIEHPSSQSHVLMGAPGMHRGDPDYFSLYVGNHILGGSGLVSRVSNEIREKRGLAYSAYSYFVPMAQDGPYTLGFQTRNDQRDDALKVLKETLQGFIDEGPTEKELRASKNNIIGGFPTRVASNGKIIEYLAVIGFYDLPLDYLNQFTTQIEKVTVKSIRSAFKRRVHPDRMTTVIVGDAL